MTDLIKRQAFDKQRVRKEGQFLASHKTRKFKAIERETGIT